MLGERQNMNYWNKKIKKKIKNRYILKIFQDKNKEK